jgi:tetratricopeptide (TPR) repeat protein
MRKRTEEALRVFERAWGRAPDDQVASLALIVVRTCPVSDEQRRQATEKVRAAVKQSRDPVRLLMLLAELENLGGRYDEAMTLYRRALEQQPGNVVALNNLAYTLTLTGGNHDEALKLVDAAIEAAGPVAELLGTRGVIQLGAGRVERAVKDLKDAVSQDPSAIRYFLLARAQNAAGERLAARVTLVRAQRKGLKEETLHPLERAAFGKLSSDLGVK